MRSHTLGNLRDGRLYAVPLPCRDAEEGAVDQPGELGRRTPRAALRDEAVGGVVEIRGIFSGASTGSITEDARAYCCFLMRSMSTRP